jgi:hypothetical protein
VLLVRRWAREEPTRCEDDWPDGGSEGGGRFVARWSWLELVCLSGPAVWCRGRRVILATEASSGACGRRATGDGRRASKQASSGQLEQASRVQMVRLSRGGEGGVCQQRPPASRLSLAVPEDRGQLSDRRWPPHGSVHATAPVTTSPRLSGAAASCHHRIASPRPRCDSRVAVFSSSAPCPRAPNRSRARKGSPNPCHICHRQKGPSARSLCSHLPPPLRFGAVRVRSEITCLRVSFLSCSLFVWARWEGPPGDGPKHITSLLAVRRCETITTQPWR